MTIFDNKEFLQQKIKDRIEFIKKYKPWCVTDLDYYGKNPKKVLPADSKDVYTLVTEWYEKHPIDKVKKKEK